MPLLTVKEMAAELQVCQETIRNHLPHRDGVYRIGKVIRIDKDAWLASAAQRRQDKADKVVLTKEQRKRLYKKIMSM